MVWPVGVLAVLAAFAGWLQFQPFWEPITHWLDPVAEPLIEATGTQELIASVCAVGARPRRDRASRGSSTCASGGRCRSRGSSSRRSSSSTSSTTRVFYKPAVALSRALQRVRRAAADRRLDHRAHARLPARLGELGRVQNGLVRSYALVLTSGVAVLAVVFIARRDDDWLTTILIFLPMAGALVLWLVPMPRHGRRRSRRSSSLIEIGFWVARAPALRLRQRRLQLDQQHTWFDRSTSATTSASSTSPSGSSA